MTKKRGRPGVSKDEWLEKGLEKLSEGGVANLTIEGLARSLGVAKAGFYWHFDDRKDLLQKILEYWIHEITEVITANRYLNELPPRQRLVKAAQIITDCDLGRYEIPIHQWALHDQLASREVRRANKLRLDFARRAFSELGITGEDAETRAMVFVCYQSCEVTVFSEISQKKRRALIEKRIDLLTRP